MLNLSSSENLDVCQMNVRICPQIYPTLIKHTQVILISKKKIWILNFANKEINFISLAQNFANFGHIHKIHKTL